MAFELIQENRLSKIEEQISSIHATFQKLSLQVQANAPFISRNMAVQRYGISLPTIDRWRLEGLIEWKQIGERRILIDVASLDAYIASL